MAKTKLRGRIVRILDAKTVVINLGRENGINNSSLFHILGDPEHVIDPETNESLGTVNVSKGRVRASQVFDKFTIARTQWVNYVASSNLFEFWGASGVSGTERVEVDEGDLRVRTSEIQPWKAKSEIPVRIGDEVEVEVDLESNADKTKSTEEKTSGAKKTSKP